MARYLTRSNVLPILIPDLGKKALKALLAEMDGLVLQGGSDICPETYGANYLNREKWPGDPFRDCYELKILDEAICNNKPVLGICRGCQLINVYFGGTLYQDLATEQEGLTRHRDAGLYDKVSHVIDFRPGLLADIYRSQSTKRVNSVHHQGIKDLGKDLRIEACCSEDGLIEAVSYKDLKKRFVLGVQWHPEFSHTLKKKVLRPELLYDHFLNEVLKRKRA